jgi:hypothetical protein
MKYFVLPALLLLSLSVSGQSKILSDITPRGTTAHHASVDLGKALSQKEAELERIRVSYPSLSPDGKSAARDAMQQLLFAMFDMSLQQKQWEARALREELDAAQYDPSHRAQIDVIDSLRQSLQKVEAQLQSRETHRERIVMQRLHELI